MPSGFYLHDPPCEQLPLRLRCDHHDNHHDSHHHSYDHHDSHHHHYHNYNPYLPSPRVHKGMSAGIQV